MVQVKKHMAFLCRYFPKVMVDIFYLCNLIFGKETMNLNIQIVILCRHIICNLITSK